MYIKVKGAYTGGHEENLRFWAVNLNHGPDSSTWYCVPKDQMDMMWNVVMQ